MPLPTGFPPELGLCLAWLLLGFAILGGFSYLSPTTALREVVSRRTYSRLLALNEWLNLQIDTQWKQTTSADVIPDLDTLSALKRRADRAHAVQGQLERRGTFVEVGRVSAVLHIVGAVLAAVVLLAGSPRPEVLAVAEPIFLLLLAVSIGLLLSVPVMDVRMSRGRDL